MWPKTTHILVFFAYAAALFLHSEGVPIPVHPTLKRICKETKFPNECISVINSRVMGRKVDALSALKEHIKGAIEAFKDAKAFTDAKIRLDTTPEATVNGLNVCKQSFTSVLSKLDGTKQCIVDRNGFDLNALLAAAATDVDACITLLKDDPGADLRTTEGNIYMRQIIANSLSLAEQFIRSKPAVKSTKPTATLIRKRSVSRPKPTSVGRSSVSRPKPTVGKRSASRPKPTSVGRSSVSRPKPTSVNAGLSSICKKTSHPNVCVSTIAPLLKGRNVDTVSALKAEMQVALVSFQQAKQLVEKAIAGGATSQIETCNTTFETALEGLQKAQKAVAGGNNSVGVLLTGVNDDVQACKEAIKERPEVKSPIPTETLEALDKISMNCLAIMRQIRL